MILPERIRRKPDPFIAPIFGKRGPCSLCTTYSDLTEAHVPPQSIGNNGHLVAQSYLISSTANRDLHFGRTFPNGIRFRTLCAECNNRLGGDEDKEIHRLFSSVRAFIESGLSLPLQTKIIARPNKFIKGIFAHLVSANDAGVPSGFDIEARDVYFGKLSLRQTRFNLFYWIYLGDFQFIMRDVFLADFSTAPLNIVWAQILKLFPVGIAVIDKPRFHGLPNMRQFITPRDNEEVEIPIIFGRWENDPVWPARPQDAGAIFFGGSGATGILARAP